MISRFNTLRGLARISAVLSFAWILYCAVEFPIVEPVERIFLGYPTEADVNNQLKAWREWQNNCEKSSKNLSSRKVGSSDTELINFERYTNCLASNPVRVMWDSSYTVEKAWTKVARFFKWLLGGTVAIAGTLFVGYAIANWIIQGFRKE